MKYRVVRIGTLEDEPDDSRMSEALALRDRFGLHHLSLTQIAALWSRHSDSYAAGWLIPDKESVESVFSVELEEIPEDSE